MGGVGKIAWQHAENNRKKQQAVNMSFVNRPKGNAPSGQIMVDTLPYFGVDSLNRVSYTLCELCFRCAIFYLSTRVPLSYGFLVRHICSATVVSLGELLCK